MELTKEEMKLVITWLEMHYYTISNYYIDDVWSPDIEKLPKVVTKFQNYLNFKFGIAPNPIESYSSNCSFNSPK